MMSNQSDKKHECEIKLICLCTVAKFCLQNVLEFYAKTAAPFEKNAEVALSVVLTRCKIQKQLKNIKTLNFKDNQRRVYLNIKQRVFKSEICIEDLDLSFLSDLLLSIPAFATCKCDYQNAVKNIIKHVVNSCIVKDVCCTKCMHCKFCNKNTFKLRENILKLIEMRNETVHSTYSEWENLLRASAGDTWKKKIQCYSDVVADVLSILYDDYSCITAEDYKGKNTDITIIQHVSKQVCLVHFYDVIQNFFLPPTPLYTKVISIKLAFELDHDKFSALEDLDSEKSEFIARNFKSQTARLLRKDLAQTSNSKLFEVATNGLKYTRELINRCASEFTLHIESKENNIPTCYGEFYSSQSKQLRKDLADKFKDILLEAFELEESSSLNVKCTGFEYGSIHLRFKVSSDRIQWNQENLNTFFKYLQSGNIKEALAAHSLDGCLVEITMSNMEVKNGLVASLEIEINDETLHESQLAIVTSTVEHMLSKIKPGDIISQLSSEDETKLTTSLYEKKDEKDNYFIEGWRNEIYEDTVPSSSFQLSIRRLLKESTESSWNELEQLVCCDTQVLKFDATDVSLAEGVKHGMSIRLLLEFVNNGANVNEVVENCSVLQLAVESDKFEISANIIHLGAIVHPQVKCDNTEPPVVVCVRLVLATGKLEILERLLSLTKDVSATDSYDNTALHYCCDGECTDEKRNIIEMLLKADINISITNKRNRMATELLLKTDPRVNLFLQDVRLCVSGKNSVLTNKLSNLKKQLHVAFANEEWKLCCDLCVKAERKMSGKDKYNSELSEVLVYRTASILKWHSYVAFHFLSQAFDLNKPKTLELLIKLYGLNYLSFLHSMIIKEYILQDILLASIGVEFLLLIVKKEFNGSFLLTYNCLLYKLNLINEVPFIEDVHEKCVMELLPAWLQLGQIEFEADAMIPSQRSFQLITKLCRNYQLNDYIKGTEDISCLYLLCILKVPGETYPLNVEATALLNKVAEDLLTDWKRKISIFINKEDYKKARNFIRHSLYLLDRFPMHNKLNREILTKLVFYYVLQKEFVEVLCEIRKAYNVCQRRDKEIAEKWRDISKALVKSDQIKLAITVYTYALKVTPTEDVLYIELYSEISLLQMKLENYERAVIDAEYCLELNPNWIEGYLRLATILNADKKYDQSYDVLIDGLKLSEEIKIQSDLLIELLKTNVLAGKKSFEDLSLSKDVICKAFQRLVEESDHLSWEILEYLVLYTSLVQHVDVNEISLLSAFHQNMSEEFVEILIKRNCSVQENCDNAIKQALDRNWFGVCCKLICNMKLYPRKNTEPAIIHCTKLAIKTGKIALLEQALLFLESTSVPETFGYTALHVCCDGTSSQSKIDAIKVLVNHGVNENVRNSKGKTSLEMLSNHDPRCKVLKDTVTKSPKKGAEVVVNQQKSRKKKRCEDGGFSNFDSHICCKNAASEAKAVLDNQSQLVAQSTDLDKSVSERVISFVNSEQFDELLDIALKNNDTIIENKSEVSKDKNNDTDSTKKCKTKGENEDVSFNDLEWEIECTEDVKDVLMKTALEKGLKKTLLECIKSLAAGEWPSELETLIKNEETRGMMLYETEVNDTCKFIWENAISYSAIRRTYIDKIRLWKIAQQYDTSQIIKEIAESSMKGKSCSLRSVLKAGKENNRDTRSIKNLPTIYVKIKSNETEHDNIVHYSPAASPRKQEFNILKFYALTSAMASRILNPVNCRFDFPFEASELEQDVINLEPEQKSPVLLLGRSGTGKTTCCLYRLWAKYKMYWDDAIKCGPRFPSITPSDSKDYEHLRQLFITKNDVLCSEVKNSFYDLCHGDKVDETLKVTDNTIYNCISEIPPETFPLFVTSKYFLLLLDSSLKGEKFFKRNADGSLKQEIVGWGNSKKQLVFIPKIYIDDDEMENEIDDDLDKSHDESQSTKKREKEFCLRELTYEVFVVEVWPVIRKGKTASYHPSIVWMEIKSFITGCANSFSNPKGFLTKEQYLKIGKKKAPNFVENRGEIYELFLKYNKLKRELNMFDESDLQFSIFKRLKNTVIPEWAFHEVYVDETQDFTQAELFLLLRCSANPNAMFFSGDTAQSIMNGVAFRFCDLTSIFFDWKRELCNVNEKMCINVPKEIYKLKNNYRSHNGILNLASKILTLLISLFPNSFDKMDPDIGLYPGPKPVILDTDDITELAMLLQGAKRKTSAIEFGAHQVILVQTEESKQRLPPELTHGLVLSIFEAKGLEFDDVLLYNFFSDSMADEEWRVVSRYKEIFDTEESSDICEDNQNIKVVTKDQLQCSYKALDFDDTKHRLLNSELKKLYTAITRARVNVWIFDENRKKRAPMFDMFCELSLVDVKKVSDKDFGTSIFAGNSSKRDWKKQGEYFYGKNMWRIAIKCFEIAEEQTSVRKCQAHLKALEAYNSSVEFKQKTISKTIVYNTYEEAAEMYLHVGLIKEAKICLINCKKWLVLASICEKQQLYGEAAKYYKKLQRINDAAENYKKAGDYQSAVDILKQKKKYFRCIQTFKEYEQFVQEDLDKIPRSFPKELVKPPRKMLTIKSIAEVACQEYYRDGMLKELESMLSFLSLEEQLSFLNKKDNCSPILKRIYIQNNRMEQITYIFLREKNFLQAAEYAPTLVMKGTCLVKEARHILMKGDWMRNNIVDMLEDVLYQLTSKDIYLKAEIRYVLMCLTGEMNKVRDTIKLYALVDNPIGTMMCFHMWIKKNPSAIWQKLDGEIIMQLVIKHVKIIIDLVIDLVNYNDNSAFKRSVDCCRKFGFVPSADNSKCSIDDYSLLEYLQHVYGGRIWKDKEEAQFVVVRGFVSKLLCSCLTMFVNDFRVVLLDMLLSVSPCGLQCSSKECRKNHDLPNQFTFQKGRQVILTILHLYERCEIGRQKMKHFNYTFEIKLINEVMQTDLLSHVYSFIDSHVLYLAIQNRHICHFFKNIPALCREQIETCIRKSWTQTSSDINLYVQLVFLAHLVNNVRPVTDSLLQKESPLQIINESLEQLFYDGFVTKSQHQVAKVLFLASADDESVCAPSLVTLCHFLVFHITLTFVSFSRMNEKAKVQLLLPEYYMKLKDIWDTLYQAKYSFNTAVSLINPKLYPSFVNFFESILRLLFGITSKKFNLMRDIVYIITHPLEQSGSIEYCERMLILILVMLSNLDVIGLSSYLERIVNMFLQNKMPLKGKGDTTRIENMFSKICKVQTCYDARKVLYESLQYMENKLVECYWDHTSQSLSVSEIVSEKSLIAGRHKLLNVDSYIIKKHRINQYPMFKRSFSTGDQKQVQKVVQEKQVVGFNEETFLTASASEECRELLDQMEREQEEAKTKRKEKNDEKIERNSAHVVRIQRWLRRIWARNVTVCEICMLEGVKKEQHYADGSIHWEILEKTNKLRELAQLLMNAKDKMGDQYYIEIKNRYSIINHQFKLFIKINRISEIEELVDNLKKDLTQASGEFIENNTCLVCGIRFKGANVDSVKKMHLEKGSKHFEKILQRERYLNYEKNQLKSLLESAEMLCTNDKTDCKTSSNIDVRVAMIKGQFDAFKNACCWDNLSSISETVNEVHEKINKELERQKEFLQEEEEEETFEEVIKKKNPPSKTYNQKYNELRTKQY